MHHVFVSCGRLYQLCIIWCCVTIKRSDLHALLELLIHALSDIKFHCEVDVSVNMRLMAACLH